MSRTMKEVSEELQTNHEKDLNKLTRLADDRQKAYDVVNGLVKACASARSRLNSLGHSDIAAKVRDVEMDLERAMEDI